MIKKLLIKIIDSDIHYVLILLMLLFFLIFITKIYYKLEAEENQAYLAERSNGIETYALVVDKNIIEEKNLKSSTTHYLVNLYVENETFKKSISRYKYRELKQGDFIEVVIKGEDIYLGNKQDEEETIRYIEKEKIGEEESSSSEAL